MYRAASQRLNDLAASTLLLPVVAGAISLKITLKSFPVKQLLNSTIAFAKELSEKAPVSMMFAKKRLQNAKLLNIKEVLKHETEAILSCMETEDWHEGIEAFMGKRKPVYKGR